MNNVCYILGLLYFYYFNLFRMGGHLQNLLQV